MRAVQPASDEGSDRTVAGNTKGCPMSATIKVLPGDAEITARERGPRTVAPLTMTREEAAEMCGVSLNHFDRHILPIVKKRKVAAASS